MTNPWEDEKPQSWKLASIVLLAATATGMIAGYFIVRILAVFAPSHFPHYGIPP